MATKLKLAVWLAFCTLLYSPDTAKLKNDFGGTEEREPLLRIIKFAYPESTGKEFNRLNNRALPLECLCF